MCGLCVGVGLGVLDRRIVDIIRVVCRSGLCECGVRCLGLRMRV